ncbi:AraC-like ligand-binding domain-containing protein [Micromonospora siamensis]|uniref:AraC-type DNA-binding protein n=1 Tax=Micromonospora siamensis TaxID=299152 RepID=A0A1C5IIN1_9ACTN|nr:helix-turn-helix domain-containing protein [Micromonospora siamensis]SCG58258.1 AraC-type DNA-binding protein [Micromonospora siamensis]
MDRIGEPTEARARVLPGQVVDTTPVPPRQRFEFWHAVVARETAPAHISSSHLHDFHAHARVVDLGRASLTALRYPSLHSTRPPALVRRCEADVYQLALPASGRSALTQDRQEAELRLPAEFTFLDASRPHVASHWTTGPDPLDNVTVQIPHRELPLAPDQVRRLVAARLRADEGMGALLAQFVRRIATHPDQYGPADAPTLAGVTLDLVSATLAQHLDRTADLPVEVRQTALRAQIDAFIDQHLGDATLTPAVVAAAHHLSPRSLHRLFADTGPTVAATIRSRRLDRCRRDLADPLLAGLPVQAIAARWGFGDKAHFSRAFRAAYGCSPRAWRDDARTRRTQGPAARR